MNVRLPRMCQTWILYVRLIDRWQLVSPCLLWLSCCLFWLFEALQILALLVKFYRPSSIHIERRGVFWQPVPLLKICPAGTKGRCEPSPWKAPRFFSLQRISISPMSLRFLSLCPASGPLGGSGRKTPAVQVSKMVSAPPMKLSVNHSTVLSINHSAAVLWWLSFKSWIIIKST